jgi:type III pantothenate kinase
VSTLLADLGNSRWKLAVARDAGLQRLAQGGYADISGLAAAAAQCDHGLVASVASRDRTQAIVGCIAGAGVHLREVTSVARLGGIVSGYRDPGQIGVDRLLAMVAVRARHAGTFCVVDAGTAVTIDVVDASGVHAGGVILPGIDLARAALLEHTAIPHDVDVDQSARLGRDTPTGVAIGARYAIAGAVERCLQAAGVGGTARVFVGGGDAERVLELMPGPCERADDLVLHGLAVVAQGGVG